MDTVRATFAPEPGSVGAARRLVERTLESWRSTTVIDVACLLTSELVTNAILHARTTVELVLAHDEHRVRVEVRDASMRPAVIARPDQASMGGRGLVLVESLADSWGVATERPGKTVWFALAI